MKIELIGENRFGITQEALTVITKHQLELSSMEVGAGHIYVDVPHLTEHNLPDVSSDLINIKGINAINVIDLLPNERRRFHLDALLANFPDPVFTIDATGSILSANAAAATPLGLTEIALEGMPIKDMLEGEYDITTTSPQRKQLQEVTLAGQPYLLELQSMQSINSSEDEGEGKNHSKKNNQNDNDNKQLAIQDCMLILHTPTRVGHHISKVQMGNIKGLNTIAGQSAAMLQVKDRAQQFASVHAPLLIQGETGTGKELFARAVHQASPWSSAAFLALNCAALPENLVESELFGYASGAFSGATRDGKPGLLELADGGTVFLDEIGEMSTYVQAKLLRFVQDGTFLRVGGKKEQKINVRLICATHRNLEQLVKEGLFREDLMYRLNVLNLTLPPLRERPEDILDLATLFIVRAANQIDCPTPSISTQAKTLLTSYAWPGNVRQLENLLFRTIAINKNKIIDANDLHLIGIADNTIINKAEPDNWKTAQIEFEKELLTRLYKHYPSTRKLAKRLEVSHTTIADKLRVYGITA
jgi:transcriptional regulator of aroF, aroG, tyrA and aromatic amino acid transport